MSEAKCDLCGDNSRVHLHSRCHMTAPLAADIAEGVLTLQCYVPECGRILGQFRVGEIADLQAENAQLREELEAVYEAWPDDDNTMSSPIGAVGKIAGKTSDRWFYWGPGYQGNYDTRREAIRAYVATRKEMKK